MFSAYRITPVVKNLLIINVLVYVASLMFPDIAYGYLMLFYPDSPNFIPTQFATYMFMHSPVSYSHILFNMMGLFFFGPTLEQHWGPKRFLTAYVIMGLGGSILHTIISAGEFYFALGTLTPFSDGILDLRQVPSMLGASGAIMGLLTAFGFLFPRQRMGLLFLPISFEARHFVPTIIVADVFFGIFRVSGDNVAHFAHLGGAIAGFLVVYFWHKRR